MKTTTIMPKAERKKPELKVGKEYDIGLNVSGSNNVIRGQYIGRNDKYHIFKSAEDGYTRYMFLKDQWIDENDGVLTYPTVCSETPNFLEQRFEARHRGTESDLLKILKELGELK